jgi:hypothetical protein
MSYEHHQDAFAPLTSLILRERETSGAMGDLAELDWEERLSQQHRTALRAATHTQLWAMLRCGKVLQEYPWRDNQMRGIRIQELAAEELWFRGARLERPN